jgi:tetraacyldisaccharide 4'-kinase
MAGFQSFLERKVEQAWYGEARWSRALIPLVPLYRQSAAKAKIRGQISAENNPLEIPVIVVGNITAGGTGKSPVVMQLARELKSRGYVPGILSRGYGVKTGEQSRRVTSQDSADEVGDEPLMMAQSLADIPVAVDRDRWRGASFLRSKSGVDLVICDDGLQHYNLPRDIEIVVVDGDRGIGNGLLIPAGPLREPVERLKSVNYVLVNGSRENLSAQLQAEIDQEFMVEPSVWRNLLSGEKLKIDQMPLSGKVLAVSAIGNPGRFHKSLKDLGLEPIDKIFPDHHAFGASDFSFDWEESELPLMMTAKDAVKCREICRNLAKPNWWVLEVEAKLPETFVEQLANRLQQIKQTKDNKEEK